MFTLPLGLGMCVVGAVGLSPETVPSQKLRPIWSQHGMVSQADSYEGGSQDTSASWGQTLHTSA